MIDVYAEDPIDQEDMAWFLTPNSASPKAFLTPTPITPTSKPPD
jgi:hypothetical protein